MGITLFREFRIARHQSKDIGNCADFIRDALLVGTERGIALLVARMIAVHSADRTLAHVARDNENSFLHQENQFADILVKKAKAFDVAFDENGAILHIDAEYQ